MFGEARREAMGLHHFVSDTRRKVFICNDRREYKNLQGEVQKLEKRKANNMKKYDDEIKDWKEILKQLQDEKEGKAQTCDKKKLGSLRKIGKSAKFR